MNLFNVVIFNDDGITLKINKSFQHFWDLIVEDGPLLEVNIRKALSPPPPHP